MNKKSLLLLSSVLALILLFVCPTNASAADWKLDARTITPGQTLTMNTNNPTYTEYSTYKYFCFYLNLPVEAEVNVKVNVLGDDTTGSQTYTYFYRSNKNKYYEQNPDDHSSGTFSRANRWTTYKMSATCPKGDTYLRVTWPDRKCDEATITVTLNLPDVPMLKTAKKVSATSARLTLGKIRGVSGYEIYRATSRNGKYTKVKSTTSTIFTNKSLTRGKSYFYKFRAYKTVNGKKYYSVYSNIKKVKL